MSIQSVICYIILAFVVHRGQVNLKFLDPCIKFKPPPEVIQNHSVPAQLCVNINTCMDSQ